jgi:hypothetical protein
MMTKRTHRMNRIAWALAAVLAAMVLTPIGPASAQGPFADVPAEHPAYAAVNELAKQGFVNGYPDSSYGGNRAMTRYELALALQRMLQRASARDFTPITLPRMPPPGPPLTDVPKDHWAADAVQQAHECGFLMGHPNGAFKGDQPVTRAEFAVVLQRLHAWLVQLVELNPPTEPARP